MPLTAIRRVVTGDDEEGRSKVVWDGPAPGTHEAQLPGVQGAGVKGRGHTDFWVWRETPPPLDGKEDAGTWDDEFPCPEGGGHLRVRTTGGAVPISSLARDGKTRGPNGR